jgi:hypothetical protein
MSPKDFWELTPYLTKKAIPALRDKTNVTAWLNAYMQRVKKMPKLEDVTSKRASEPVDVEAKLKSLFKAHNLKATNG